MPVEPNLATFFVHYPEALGLPANGSHIIHFEAPMVGYAELDRIVLHYDGEDPWIELPSDLAGDPFVSIRIHRGTRESEVTRTMRELGDVVGRVSWRLSAGLEMPEVASGDDRTGAFTVVELVTPLAVPTRGGTFVPVAPGDDVMGGVLNHAMEGLQEVVTGFRLAERTLLAIPCQERMGALITVGIRSADPSKGGWDEGSLVLNGFSMANHPLEAPRPTDGLQERLATALEARRMGMPIAAVLELEADAAVARERNGDYRSSVVLEHTAVEVFLDAVLMSILWEEGRSPREAIGEFNPSLVSRVRSKYHPRLGGAWSTRSGAVGDWYRDVVRSRHWVAHAGIVLTRDTAHDAARSGAGLRTFVLDRLSANHRKYPFTAAHLVTEAGFRRRSLWTRQAKATIADRTNEELRSFLDWRARVLTHCLVPEATN